MITEGIIKHLASLAVAPSNQRRENARLRLVVLRNILAMRSARGLHVCDVPPRGEELCAKAEGSLKSQHIIIAPAQNFNSVSVLHF